MGENERTYEYPDEPNLMTPDQVEFVHARTYNILDAQCSGFGIGGNGHNSDELKWSQLILKDLLFDLKSSQTIPALENPDGELIYENLVEYSLVPLNAIVTAPNLGRRHKTQLITEYPDMLFINRFTMTMRGAKTRVGRTIKEAKFISPLDLDQHRQIVRDVEQNWRKDRNLKLMRFLGIIADHGYHLKNVRFF